MEVKSRTYPLIGLENSRVFRPSSKIAFGRLVNDLADAPQITFANHVRKRSSALINLLPFPHHFQNVLKAIAYIDWQRENGVSTIDYETYLGFADIVGNETAIAYLDWLEPKLRNWLSRYEQMLEVHRHELAKLMVTFDRDRG